MFVRVVLNREERSGRTSTLEPFMQSNHPQPYDVLIAGTGPVGHHKRPDRIRNPAAVLEAMRPAARP
jgi:hypothetical protein